MALTKWNESYSVKVDKLDTQHKDVFEMINNLADAMRTGKGASAIQPTLARLTKHLQIHIEDEEELMRRTNYPGLASHQEEHRLYLLRVKKFQTDVEEEGNEDTVNLLFILRDIILDHMVRADLAYTAHLNANGIR